MTKPKAIPAAALGRRLAFVGTTGSGKTYTAKGGVERKLAAKERVVIIDPLDVWWGLALNVDGKTASPYRSDTVAGTSQQLVIFGGKHADMQITENGGKLLGEAVATAKESCIISLGGLRTEAARRRFMVGFLDALYEHTDPEVSEPYTLVVDEADLFAPQKPFGGHAEMLLHLMEEIVRRGRVRGFLPWLISQRPAIVNKNVLSQVDGMVAMQLTGAHDRGAIEAWIEGHADKRETKELLASLATFHQGTGLLWVPRDGILETMTFPQNATFDSSRTPKRGEKKKAHKLRPLNLGKLKDMLASVEAETKANDPNALRKQVADLQAQLRKVKAPPAAPAIDPRAIQQAEARGHARGKIEGYADCMNEIAATWREAGGGIVQSLKIATSAMETADKRMKASLERATTKYVKAATKEAGKNSSSPAVISSTADTSKAAPAPVLPRAINPAPAASGDGSLTNPQKTLLQALAWWRAMGHDEPSRPQIAAIAGWKPSGSNLKDRLSELSKLGHVTYPRQNHVALTDSGAAAAPAPNMSTTLHDSIRGILTGPQNKLFEVLLSRRSEISRADLAASVEPPWEPNGSNLKDRLSELSRLEIVSYPQKGTVILQPWVLA